MPRYRFDLIEDKLNRCDDCLEPCRHRSVGGMACLDGKFSPKYVEVTNSNSCWAYEQFKKDLFNARIAIESTINHHNNNDLLELGSPLEDYYVMLDLMISYIKYANSFENNTYILANLFSETRILVENKVIKVHSEDLDLLAIFKKIAKDNGYKFVIIKKLEETNEWWNKNISEE